MDIHYLAPNPRLKAQGKMELQMLSAMQPVKDHSGERRVVPLSSSKRFSEEALAHIQSLKKIIHICKSTGAACQMRRKWAPN